MPLRRSHGVFSRQSGLTCFSAPDRNFREDDLVSVAVQAGTSELLRGFHARCVKIAGAEDSSGDISRVIFCDVNPDTDGYSVLMPAMKHVRFPAPSLLTILAVLSITACSRGADEVLTNRFSIIAGPVLQCAAETSMRVTWITDRSATGTVEYGPVDGELKTVFASHHGLIDANQRVHSVVLTGLQPGAACRYRVVSREIVNFGAYKVDFGSLVASEFRQFHAFDRRKGEFSFLVFNDLHDQAATIPELLQRAGPQLYDFVVLNGDTVSHTDNEKPVISMLSQATASFASSTPLFWVRGNHEARGSFARELPRYMGLPEERYYYAFDHGPVHFVVLDVGEDKMDSSPEYSGLVDFSRYRREQGEWLKAHVGEKSFRRAKFRVVICHMPFARNPSPARARTVERNVFTGMEEAYEQFGRTLEKAGIDLMISGHVHSAAVIPPEPPRHSYPIIQGGGNKPDNRTLIRVNVSSEGLKAVILRPDGSQFAACQVKPRSSRSFFKR